MKTVVLLLASNIFMTYAWYGHLKNMQHKPLVLAVLVSWEWLFLNMSFRFRPTGSAIRRSVSVN